MKKGDILGQIGGAKTPSNSRLTAGTVLGKANIYTPVQNPIINQPKPTSGFSFAPMPDYTEKQKKANKKLQEEANKISASTVTRGGAGIQGALGEVAQMGRSIDKKVVQPIETAPLAYRYGDLQKNLSLEYYKRAQGEPNKVEKIAKQLVEFEKKYPEISKSKNIITQTITSAPSSVESQVQGFKQGGILGVGGALISGGIAGLATGGAATGAGATAGAKLLGGAGYVKGTTESTYKMEYGSAYQTMVEMGVPKEIAKKEAKNVGLINAGIEGGESILDLATMGNFSKLTGAVKSSLIKKYGGEVVDTWLKKAGKSYLMNIPSEAIEETLQEKSTIEGEKRATQQAGIVRDNSQDINRLKQSAIGGAAGAVLLGGATNVLGSFANTGLNKVTQPTKPNLERPTIELPQNNINTPTNVETPVKTPEIAYKQPVTVNEVEKVLQNRNATVEDATRAIMADNKLEPRYESAVKYILNLNQLTKKNTPALDLSVQELPKTETGMTIDGYLDGDTIVLNTNVNNPIMETTIHEGVHFLRNSENYDDMKEYVLTTLDKQGKLTELYDEIEQTYRPIYEKKGRTLTEDNINDEIIANFYAKNGLANEDFINKLANDNRNVAQKIYDFVKNKVTEMSKISKMTVEERETYEFYKKAEKLYVKALKGKFETSTNGKQMSVSEDYEVKNSKGEVVSNYDSTGKKLPKEVVEYFKDSKVRDEKGNLLVVYHGTPNGNFNIFKSKQSVMTDLLGYDKNIKAFYFAKDKNYAQKMSSGIGNDRKTFELYLNIENPIILSIKEIEDIRYNKKLYDKHTEDGYDGAMDKDMTQFVAFNSNQIKETTNLKPTSSEDIRYKTEVKPIDKTAIRSVPKTISGSLDKKTIDVVGNMEYVVQTDKNSLRNAKKEIKDIGYDELLTTYQTKFKKNERFTKDDFVTMGLLINEARQKGDIVAQVDLVTTLAIMSTEAGQTNQSISVIRSLGPEGRAISVIKYLQRQNTTLKNKKGFTEIKLPQEFLDKILNSKNSNDTDLAVSNAIQHITDQVPLTWKERINNWRYMAMLTNPVTHLRNIVSNIAMAGTQRSKDVIAAGIEDIVRPTNRTKTLKKANKDQIDYSKKDYEAMKDRLNNINSYGLNKISKIEKRLFDTKWLNATGKLNTDTLSAEDNFFKRLAYTKAVQGYMAANNLTSEYLDSGTRQSQKELEKMREYATIQSLEATFQQDNSFANSLNELKKKEYKSKAGTVLKDMALGAVIPFTKTPSNILVTGVEYSPIGIVKGLYETFDNVKNGKINGNQAIDSLAKGMTGTSIVMLGMYLASKGLLNGSSGEEDELDKQLGKQAYSLNIGGKTYSLNWLSPVGIPLFLGVEMQKLMEKDDKFNGWEALEGMSGMLDPMTEMSMLQGLNSTLRSYGDSQIEGIAVNALQNYTSQFYPSLFARIAKITDDKQRNITSTSTNALEKKYETYINAQINKVPFLNKTLQPKYDIWGREISTGDLTSRTLQNLVSPGFLRDDKKDNVSKELNRLFKNDIKAFPNFASDYFTANKKEINLTEEQWAKRIKLDGETSYKALSQLFNSKYYKSLPESSDDSDKMTKEKAIKSVYDYADNVAKAQFIKDDKTKRDLKKTINRSETKLWNLFDIKKRG